MASNFKSFINTFPEVALPVILTEDSALVYSRDNPPIPERLMMEFILPHEKSFDELTEFVACFRIKNLKNFHALVYWRGGLMDYQYIMLTLSKEGKLIDRRVLAGTFSNGSLISRSVAHLDDDMSITIVSGISGEGDDQYEAATSTTIDLELLPDGRLIELV